MLDELDLKIRQMHQALSDLESTDLSRVKTEYAQTPWGEYYHIDVGEGRSDADLANAARLLIANIASIKDHLKDWCSKHGKKRIPGTPYIITVPSCQEFRMASPELSPRNCPELSINGHG